MRDFKITARTASAETLTFVRRAKDAASAAEAVRSEGMLVLAVQEIQSEKFVFRRASQMELETALRQISSMLKSAVTLSTALKTVEEQAQSSRTRKVWYSVRQMVYRGDSFADSLSRHKGYFDEMVVRLAEVGEKSGELGKALSRAADQLESRRDLKTAVMNALLYPTLAVVMAFGVSTYLVVSVIPKLGEFLRSSGGTLPPITQMLMNFSDWTIENSILIVFSFVFFVGLWFAIRLTKRGRELQDAFLLRIPITGRILRLSGTALFSRSMQIMIESGVTLLDSLGVCARLLPNTRLRRRVADARESVMRGMTLENSLAPATEFMPMLKSMVAVGEAGGSLPESFGETARFHEMMLHIAVKRFGMLIEPVMIIVTGVIVGFVYIAFFMALFAIASAN